MAHRYNLESRPLGSYGFTVGMFDSGEGEWIRYDRTDHDTEAREFYDTVCGMSRNPNSCWCDIQNYIEGYMED